MGNWNRDWHEAVRRQAKALSLRIWDGSLAGREVEQAICDLVYEAVRQVDKRQASADALAEAEIDRADLVIPRLYRVARVLHAESEHKATADQTALRAHSNTVARAAAMLEFYIGALADEERKNADLGSEVVELEAALKAEA